MLGISTIIPLGFRNLENAACLLLYLQNVPTTPNDTTTSKASIKFSGVKKKFAHITLPSTPVFDKTSCLLTAYLRIITINFETKLLGKIREPFRSGAANF